MKKNKKRAIFFLLMLILLVFIFLVNKYGPEHLMIIFKRVLRI